MNVKPLSDRVLILPNPAEEKTAGGFIKCTHFTAKSHFHTV